MNTYETIFISTPNLSEDEEKSTVEVLQSVITDGGGTVHIAERMGRRRLAYPIRKFDDGVYTRFLYDSDTAVPKELDRRMRLSDRVLRALTVRLHREWASDSKEQAVRILQQQAEDAARAAEEAAAREAEGNTDADSAADAGGESASEATTSGDEPARSEPAADDAASKD